MNKTTKAILQFTLLTLAANPTMHAGTTTAGTNTNTSTTTAKNEPNLAVPPPYIEPTIPEAHFTIPKKREEGKDPFFPKSNLVYDGEAPKIINKGGTVPIVAELILRGISGTDETPLAIINNTTFGIGDELDVTTKAGKLRLRCLEINKTAGTAAVQLGSERRELHLPPAK